MMINGTVHKDVNPITVTILSYSDVTDCKMFPDLLACGNDSVLDDPLPDSRSMKDNVSLGSTLSLLGIFILSTMTTVNSFTEKNQYLKFVSDKIQISIRSRPRTFLFIDTIR